jgi:hypothetical protein
MTFDETEAAIYDLDTEMLSLYRQLGSTRDFAKQADILDRLEEIKTERRAVFDYRWTHYNPANPDAITPITAA